MKEAAKQWISYDSTKNPLTPDESFFFSKYSDISLSEFMKYTSITSSRRKSKSPYLQLKEVEKEEEKVLSDNDLFENVLNDLKKVNAEIY